MFVSGECSYSEILLAVENSSLFLYYNYCIFVFFFQMTMYLNLYFGVFIILASAYGESTTVIASSKQYKLERFLSSRQKWSNGATESERTARYCYSYV